MLNDILTIGDKIDIKPLDKDNDPIKGARTYASMLAYIEDDETIHITAPIVLNTVIFLNAGNKYQLHFYTSKGLLQCNCVAVDNYKDNKALIYIVKLTSVPTKLQRRQYYRLECIQDIEYTILEENTDTELKNNDIDNEKIEISAQKWQKGAIIDISGGGIRFISANDLHKGDKIKIKLELMIGNKLRKMEPDAVVIASEKVINRRDLFEHRVQYYNISKIDREALIRYIFEQDRKRRKNEKAD